MMSSRLRFHQGLVPGVVLICSALVVADQAQAFQCTEGQAGGPSLAWTDRTVTVNMVAADTEELEQTEVQQILANTIAEWNAPGCSDFEFVLGSAAADPRAGFDWAAGEGNEPNENILAFRSGEVGDDAVDAWLHPATALAITTVTFVRQNGKILDADIEVNDGAFTFSACDPDDCVVAHDAQNMLAHELGHVLGLDHPSQNQAGAREATMFSSAPQGEIQKRDLDQDDIDGLCTIYPAGDETGECTATERVEPPAVVLKPVPSGCLGSQTEPGDLRGALVLLGLLLAPWAARRRLTSRRRKFQGS